MACYLLHFSPYYKHAGHYLGYAADVAPRVNAHLHGRGARLTQVAAEAGCTMILVRVWEDATRADERRFKRCKNGPAFCPICNGQGVQLPLLFGEVAYVPSAGDDDGQPVELGHWANVDQIALLPAAVGVPDYEAEVTDLQDARFDEQFWRSGAW